MLSFPFKATEEPVKLGLFGASGRVVKEFILNDDSEYSFWWEGSLTEVFEPEEWNAAYDALPDESRRLRAVIPFEC